MCMTFLVFDILISQSKKKRWKQTEEMAQWIKHLPQKHEELNSNPQNPHKAGDSSSVCLSCQSVYWEMGGGNRRIPMWWVLTANLAECRLTREIGHWLIYGGLSWDINWLIALTVSGTIPHSGELVLYKSGDSELKTRMHGVIALLSLGTLCDQLLVAPGGLTFPPWWTEPVITRWSQPSTLRWHALK